MEELELTPEQKIKCDADFAAMNEKFDILEKSLENSFPPADFPLQHTFTKGLYSRKIFIPAGSFVTSKIHMTEHQFVILRGSATFWDPHLGTVLLRAPHTGITKPYTRRILFVHEDFEMATFHNTDKTTPQEVEDDITMHYVNPLLEREYHKLEDKVEANHGGEIKIDERQPQLPQ